MKADKKEEASERTRRIATKHYGGGKKKKVIIGVIITVVILALAGFIVWQQLQIRTLKDPTAAAAQAQEDAKTLSAKVGKLMQLPDETPTVATVQDASKLKGQDFFKDAKNGDKVLIFTSAKKAVIYRESDNKIINSGPIVLNSATATDTSTTDQDK